MSTNGIALVVLVLEALLSSLGIEFDAGSVEKAVEGILVAGALILAVRNQLQRGDIRHFLFRK